MTSTPVWDAYRTAISEGAAHWTAKGADPMSAAAAVTVMAYRVDYRDGMVRHLVDLRRGASALRLASFPCERYSAAALRRADYHVRGYLTTVSEWLAGSEPSGWEVVGRYGHGWEVVTTEMTKAEALERLREYRANDPVTEYRVRREVSA